MRPRPNEDDLSDLEACSDEDLLRLFRETRDRKYFAALFERHCAAVLVRCRCILQDAAAAEEITQDTFIQAFNHSEMFYGGSVRAWLMAIGAEDGRHVTVTLNGHSYDEIAHITGWEVGAVRSLIQNGRIQFAKLWKAREDTLE